MRTAFLARRASTSKSRLKKGSRAVLRPDRAPSLYNSPHEPCSPRARLCWERQGQAVRCPHNSLNTEWGVESERACKQGPPVHGQPRAPLPNPTTRHPFHIYVSVTSVPR